MPAPLGNRYWESRSVNGRKPKYKTADDLLEGVIEYFEWVEDNPLQVAEKVTYEGYGDYFMIPKARPATIVGMCLRLGISRSTWNSWKQPNNESYREDFLEVINAAEEAMYSQKFDGAAAGIFNANIIARDLGLAEKSEITGKDGGSIQHEVAASDKLKDLIDVVAKRSNNSDD